MKRLIPFIVLLIIIGIPIFLFIVKSNVGDENPSLLPPSQKQVSDTTTNPEKAKISLSNDLLLTLPSEFEIGVFAKDLGVPRDLALSPGGTILVSIPSQGRVVALPDVDNSGDADQIIDIVTNLNRPHGITFFNNTLFIVEETQVVSYSWNPETLKAQREKILFSLPRGGRHFTRSITFDKSSTMYISLGSTCDTCYEKNEFIASVITSDISGTKPRLFAKGLRNSPFIMVNESTNEVWGTEMGRDFLGDNLPPDEINVIKDGEDYGWPVCFGNKIHDTQFDKNTYIRDPCLDTESPVYEIPAHSAPLGLLFIYSPQFPAEWQGDLLVAYHGSWNSSVPVGYKVVRLNVEGNRITGSEDFITGFLQGSQADARPVDLVFDKEGSLYLSDDKAGRVYKIVEK